MLLTILAMAAALDTASPPDAPVEVRFAPLLKSERGFARLGPVGPFYPQKAAQLGRQGEAVLDCQVASGARLIKCKVRSETPAKYDFGVAARVMADRGRVLAPEEASIGAPISVRVPFALGAPVQVAP